MKIEKTKITPISDRPYDSSTKDLCSKTMSILFDHSTFKQERRSVLEQFLKTLKKEFHNDTRKQGC